jgi:hypothetical protein
MSWQPTLELRWIEEDYEQNTCFPCGWGEQRYRGGVMVAKWRLQQKWLSDVCAVEWRDVPVAEKAK